MPIALVMLPYAPTSKTHMRDLLTIPAERGAQVDVIHPGEHLVEVSAPRAGRDRSVLIESGGWPPVVDMPSFPGFKGVREAPLRLAEHIYAAARRARQARA